jgi:hypothetical protein
MAGSLTSRRSAPVHHRLHRPIADLSAVSVHGAVLVYVNALAGESQDQRRKYPSTFMPHFPHGDAILGTASPPSNFRPRPPASAAHYQHVG